MLVKSRTSEHRRTIVSSLRTLPPPPPDCTLYPGPSQPLMHVCALNLNVYNNRSCYFKQYMRRMDAQIPEGKFLNYSAAVLGSNILRGFHYLVVFHEVHRFIP